LWQYGTSTWSALTAGRSFNYIALATLLVATIPFNGFILQNAISTVSEIQPTPVTLKTSSRESLPLGWSANVNSDGTLGTVPFSIGFFMGDFLAGTGAMSYEFRTSPGCDADATCTGRLAATSFYTTCTPSTIPFDMPADDTTNVTMDATIFSSALSWEKSKPYEMNLRVQWKPLDQDCESIFSLVFVPTSCPSDGPTRIQGCNHKSNTSPS
jgi:hypothetical protein